MPQYLSPGVYVEETPSAARPIAGVGTSTAGFIGVVGDNVVMPLKPGKTGKNSNGTTKSDDYYQVAPVSKPQLITSWEQFKNNFGDIQEAKAAEGEKPAKPGNATLAHAVYGFFNNGGTRCWVIRVTDITSLDNSLELFAPIDEISIVAVPGAVTNTQHKSILAHCFKLQDRFAILDGVKSPGTLTPASIAPGGRDETGSYGAVYFPWVKVSDPATGEDIDVPPSGHIAGIYARNDATRGVHKAPANEVVLGATGLVRPVSKTEQDGLNPAGVNVIRSFNGSIKIWGARTLADEARSDFKYISTRRLFNFLRESIDAGTQWVVFEPNTPALWQGITRNVTAFLTGVWRAGALFGNTPQEAFYVKCDADTNPPDQRDLGMVVTEIGVSIVRPAEFVIFRIGQWSGPGK